MMVDQISGSSMKPMDLDLLPNLNMGHGPRLGHKLKMGPNHGPAPESN